MSDLMFNTDKLRKMILENPTLPIVVMADGETSCADEDHWWYQSDVRCSFGVILDCELNWTDKFYYDEDDFEEDLSEYLYDTHEEMGEKELEELIEKKLKFYEPYWKKVIEIRVSN